MTSAINAMLKKFHRGRVAKDVGRDPLLLKGRAAPLRLRHVFGDEVFDAIAAEGTTAGVRKQPVRGATRPRPEPPAKNVNGLLAQRGEALFPAFPEATHVRAAAESEIVDPKAGEFGAPKPSLDPNEKERMVSLPRPGAAVRGRQNGLDLLACEKTNRSAVEALVRHRKDALDDGAVARLFKGHVAEERPYRSQADVSASRAVAPALFDVVEKRADQGGIEVLEAED